MNTLSIQPTERTPEMSFDFDGNVFTIKGESFPEDVMDFYAPHLECITSHLCDLKDSRVDFTFAFTYFNSSTAKVILKLFDLLDDAAKRNKVIITWAFERDDDNTRELGEEFGEDLRHATFKLSSI